MTFEEGAHSHLFGGRDAPVGVPAILQNIVGYWERRVVQRRALSEEAGLSVLLVRERS